MAEADAPNLADQFLDAEVDYQVDLLRFSEGVREKVEHNFEDLVLELAALLLSGNLTPRATVRTEKLIKQAQRSIDTAYRQNSETLTTELVGLAKAEAELIPARYNGMIRGELFSTAVHPAEAKELATNSMIRGAPQKEWWEGQKRSTQQRFATQVRLGVLQGETTPQLVQRIVGKDTGQRRVLTVGGEKRVVAVRDGGVMQVSKKDAEALVRTSVATVSNNVLKETYEANSDVLRGTQHVSTLDLRTSPVCRVLDGGAWDFDGNPLPESKVKAKDPGYPPLHWKCRSTRIPLTKSWDELSGGRLKGVAEIPPSTRASMDGQVAQDKTYSDWLKTKTEVQQRQVLGDAGFRLWKGGKTDVSGMVDLAGKPLTIEALVAKAQGQ